MINNFKQNFKIIGLIGILMLSRTRGIEYNQTRFIQTTVFVLVLSYNYRKSRCMKTEG
jgi:hypothetical protein